MVNSESPPLGKEEYFSARFLGRVSRLIGQKGEMYIGIFQYARWVDNIIDESELSTQQRQDFILRQKKLLDSTEESPNDLCVEERAMLALPWNFYSTTEQILIKTLTRNLFGTIEFDINHSHCEGRSHPEVTSYLLTLFKSAIRGTSVIINKKDVSLDGKSFDDLMYAWFMLGSLMHFKKDITSGLFHFPVETQDQQKLLNLPMDERQQLILTELLDEEKFSALKKQFLYQTLLNSFAFMQTDLPFWQKFLSSLYSFQIALKHSKATFPLFS